MGPDPDPDPDPTCGAIYYFFSLLIGLKDLDPDPKLLVLDPD